MASDARDLDFCYLTTLGRESGAPHQIEIWFRSTIGTSTYSRATTARVVSATDEDAVARPLLVEKYRPRYPGELDGWGRTAIAIAIEWDAAQVV